LAWSVLDGDDRVVVTDEIEQLPYPER